MFVVIVVEIELEGTRRGNCASLTSYASPLFSSTGRPLASSRRSRHVHTQQGESLQHIAYQPQERHRQRARAGAGFGCGAAHGRTREMRESQEMGQAATPHGITPRPQESMEIAEEEDRRYPFTGW